MWDLARQLRGLAVAVVALAITAGIALGGGSMPDAAAGGLETAAEAAGKVVPVANEPGSLNEESDEASDEESNEESDGDSNGHGTVVSEAARMETPDGFRNHGQWVSCVARMTHGEGAAPIDLSAITVEACPARGRGNETAEAAKGQGKAQGKSQGKGRGAERSAAARAGG